MQEGSLLDFGTCYQLEFDSNHMRHRTAPLGSRGSFAGSAACRGVGWVFAISMPLNGSSGGNSLVEMDI